MQFSALFSYMLWDIELKFGKSLSSYKHSIKFECRQFSSIFVGVMSLFKFEYWKYTVFRTLLLHALTYWAEFCMWLCFTVQYIKFEYRQFDFFVGVMPLVELRVLKIHSFSHFSLTCFDIFSWNFTYDFVLLYDRWSLSVVYSNQFL